MDLSGLIRWEWLIMFGIALGLCLNELRVLRRDRRRDAARQARGEGASDQG